MQGEIDETCMPVEKLHETNKLINPILKQLKETTFFRLFKANFEGICPFWNERLLCESNKCGVWECDEKEIPHEWEDKNFSIPLKICSSDVNKSLSVSDARIITGDMNETDWMHNEEYDEGSVYINLNENSEAYTMYNGSKIWRAIYEENCFNRGKDAKCSEEQILY